MSEEIRVLHVDDEPDFADLTGAFLERADDRFYVETAADVDAGERRLAAGRYDCVVSDYDMPGRTGIEFLESVRERYPDLPFVLFTGKGSEEVASDAISAGATDYLQKESGTEQYGLLANRVRNAVEQYRSRRAEQRLLELAENTERIVFIYSRDWDELLFVSSAYEEVWNRPIDDLVADPTDFLEGVHPDDRERVRATMRTVSGGEAAEVECRVNATEGYGRWVRIRSEPIVDTDGDVVRVAGFGVEVTSERRRRRRRARQRETLVDLATDEAVTAGEFTSALRRITETAADVLDVDRVNVWVTDDAAAVADTVTEPATGNGDRFVCVDGYDRSTGEHDRGATLHTEAYPTYVDALASNRAIDAVDARTDPRTAELGDYLSEHDVGAVLDGTLRSEGSVIGTVCHEHVGGSREWTDDEIEFASDLADVVHRALRNHERGARERELRRYESVIQSLTDAVYALDDEGRIEFVNDRYAEMKGAEPEELIGTSIGRWVDGPVLERSQPMYEQVKRGERDVGRVEYAFRTADGERIPAELRFTTLERPGEGAGRVGVIRDVTERKRDERELERQNCRLSEFASVVSHDLRNPLRVAEGNLAIVRETADSVEADRIDASRLDADRLDTVANALERMDALIEDLLTLARDGETVEGTGPVELASTATECWGTVDTGAAEVVIEDDAVVHADRGRLRQLFENLFRNAVEHGTPDDGSDAATDPTSDAASGAVAGCGLTVTVGALADGRGFYVEDDGVGIADDDRVRVFEGGYSTTAGGTGFGLTISEQVADAHGWTITATEGAAGGARFEVTGVDVER